MSASFVDLKRSAVEQSRRKLSQIELVIHGFSEHAAKLHEVVETEEARVGIFDPKHFAYSCYAKAVAQRRDNLRRSIEDLKQQLREARADYEDALSELTGQEERPAIDPKPSARRARAITKAEGPIPSSPVNLPV